MKHILEAREYLEYINILDHLSLCPSMSIMIKNLLGITETYVGRLLK